MKIFPVMEIGAATWRVRPISSDRRCDNTQAVSRSRPYSQADRLFGIFNRALLTSVFAGVIFATAAPGSAIAQCSASGTLLNGSTVTCLGSQITRVGQGAYGDNITVTVNNGADITVLDTNAIALGNNATITLGASGPIAGGSAASAPVIVKTTTDALTTDGQYGDGSNTIDVGSNSTIIINRNASVIAAGTQLTAEAINPYGSGNTIINYGVVQGGVSSAINFQDVHSDATSTPNVVDNYGTIQLSPDGTVNYKTTGQAITGSGNVGIDFINETGAKVVTNLELPDGDDHVTLNTGSSISGRLDGNGGNNLLTLNALGTSSDVIAGQFRHFQTLDKTGSGTWTLTGAISNNGGNSPLSVNIVTGTLVLTGDNSAFNGSIVINPGSSPAVAGSDPTATLEARAQSLPSLITDHGILLVNQVSPDGIQSADGTYAGVIQGTGTVTKIGTGILTLSGVNTYSGGTNLNVGAIAVAADSALGNAAGSLTFNGGTLRFLGNFDLAATRSIVLDPAGAGLAGGGTIDTNGFQTVIAQAISGSGGLTKAGDGQLTLTGANIYAGGTTIAAGTLQLGDGGTSGSIIGNLLDNGTLSFDRSDTLTLGGTISGAGAVTQIGSGTTALTSTNTYTGGTTIAAGTLQLGNGGTTGSIAGDVVDNGTLSFDRSDSVTFVGAISGTGGLLQAGAGTSVLLATNSYMGGTTISAGTLQLGNGGTTGSIVGDVVDNGTLSFDRSDAVTFSGAISGAGGLLQSGTGTTTLLSTNSYTGGTTIAAGTLQIGNGGTTGSIVGDVVDNGTLSFDRSDAVTFGGAISGSGGLVQAGTGTTTLTSTSTYAGGTTIAAGALQLGNGGTTGSIVGNVTDNGRLVFDRSDAVTFAGAISGTGGIAQIGSGATILNNINSYVGVTNVAAGTLVVGDSVNEGAALSGGGAVNVAAGATLGGYGTIAGTVNNSGVVTAGNAMPLFSSLAPGRLAIGGLSNQGSVNLAGSSIGNTLVVNGNYTSTGGSLTINTLLNAGGPLSAQVTDRLLINGNASGSTIVNVIPSGTGAATNAATATASDGISIIQVGGTSASNTFALAGGFVTNGTPFQYHLVAYGPGSASGSAAAAQSLVGNPGNQWDYRLQTEQVTPTGPTGTGTQPGNTGSTSGTGSQPGDTGSTSGTSGTPPSNTHTMVAPQVPSYITMSTALFNAGFEELDSLVRRLGEVRDNQMLHQDESELFIRGIGGMSHYTSDRSFAGYGYNASQDYAATQFGLNRIVVDDDRGIVRAGLAFTVGHLNFTPSAVDGVSQGSFGTESVAGIATWLAPNGLYVDAIISAGLFNGHISTADRGQVTGMNGSSVSGSLETGYKIPLEWQNVAIEPQAQLIYQHLEFAHRTDVDGIAVDAGSLNQGIFRVGARLTKQFTTDEGALLSPYLKANLLQGIGGGDSISLSGVAFGTGRFGRSVELGAGITGTLTPHFSIYTDASWKTNVDDGGSRGWAFTGGIRGLF